jgi:hypothetical protein
MTMTELTGIKPGDTLFISNRWSKWLDKVDRITPTGRVILKNGTQFNPDGYQRGQTGWDRTSARPATNDDIAGINRSHLVQKLSRFQWDKLGAEDLKAVGEIAAKYPDAKR